MAIGDCSGEAMHVREGVRGAPLHQVETGNGLTWQITKGVVRRWCGDGAAALQGTGRGAGGPVSYASSRGSS
jgi:hypothetical protein